jgi:isoleucyl-tRNA synthetase
MTTNGATVLDRYLLAKTRELVALCGERMDAYDIAGACQAVLEYLEALNNWYIRRSRPRFWKSDRDADKQAAYDTLFTALTTLCRVASPLLPFLTDEIYRGLSGGESVHLSDWPDTAVLPNDAELVSDMDRVRDVCSSALGMRRQQNVRVRQPLAKLIVAGPSAQRLAPYLDLVRDEVNVKQVELSEAIEAFASFRLQLNSRALGPRLGGEMKKALAAAKAGDWKRDAEGVTVGGQPLLEGEYSLLLEAKSGVACQALASGEMIAVLDFTLSDALVQEGLARDLVRLVQQARRDAGLHVADRIRLSLALPESASAAVRAFSAYVQGETLASELDLSGALDAAAFQVEAELGGEKVRLALAKASV